MNGVWRGVVVADDTDPGVLEESLSREEKRRRLPEHDTGMALQITAGEVLKLSC